MELGRVVRGERGRDPALRPVAGRLRERRARDEHDARALARRGAAPRRARRRRRRRRRCRLGWASLRDSAMRGGLPYRHRCAALLPPRELARARHRPASREQGADPGDRGGARGARLARLRAARGARGRAGARRPRSTREQYVDAIRAAARGGRRLPRRGHGHEPRLVQRGAARGGRRVRDGGRAARRRRAVRVLRPAPARPPRRARDGDGLLPLQQRRDRRAARARRPGAERVLVLDWDVHHGNGTNDIFHSRADVLFASIHQSPLYPGTGPLSDAGSGRGGGVLAEPAGAAGLRRGHVRLARGARGRARRARVRAAASSSSRPATTPTATTRSRRASSRTARTARWPRACASWRPSSTSRRRGARGRLRPGRARALGGGDDRGARQRRSAPEVEPDADLTRRAERCRAT